MKYLVAILIGVIGTTAYLKNTETNEQRVTRQVANFCSCHKGVDVFVYLPDDFMGYLEIQCKDGTQMNSKGKTDNIELGGGDGCQD
jgi:hypothetical protein